ncbi:hypothetical protein E2C01_019217 [Portunus trituberculatus]|uniref:Uncharacterized protein n=1 Tax=Portunus trituberculatus TaxID=210409 RepID=A0A5B7DYK9_PORTR|nr:hypothetical protein [Portunus trituberculatus]
MTTEHFVVTTQSLTASLARFSSYTADTRHTMSQSPYSNTTATTNITKHNNTTPLASSPQHWTTITIS